MLSHSDRTEIVAGCCTRRRHIRLRRAAAAVVGKGFRPRSHRNLLGCCHIHIGFAEALRRTDFGVARRSLRTLGHCSREERSEAVHTEAVAEEGQAREDESRWSQEGKRVY